MKRVTLPANGLATDPNPLLTAAQGGMRRADNVVVVSDGAVMPRPGFGSATEKSTSYRPRSMTVFGGEPFVVSVNGGSWRIESSSAVLTGEAEPPDTTESPTQWAEARQSLYYTTVDGVRKVTGPAASATASAGLEMLISTIGPSTNTTGPFPSPCQYAYRFVFVRTDANGYIIRSAPSPKVVAFCNASNFYLDWSNTNNRVSIPSWLAAGDQIEVYRSRASADINTAPSSELYLTATHTVTSTNVSNGYVVLPNDYTIDDALGAALYTNPSQHGIAASKTAPPTAVSISYWNSCMWFGNTAEPNRLELRLIDAGTSATTTTGITEVASLLDVTYTSGSPSITNVSTVTNVVVGMAISGTGSNSPATTGTYVPAGTYVGSISGAGPYTIGMVDSAGSPVNALASNTLQTARFHDVVKVGGVEFYAANSVQYLPGYALNGERCFILSSSANLETRLVRIAEALSLAVNMYATKNPSFLVRAYNLGDISNPLGSYAPGTIAFEEIGTTGASFQVQSVTKPNAVNPTTSSALTSTSDVSPARIFWSDPDEPEAAPTIQFVDVGNQRDPILALSALRAALLVFKKDGIYRITGAPPDNWTIELLDGSTRLLYGSCVDVLDDVAFALTNRGAVTVDEGGTRNISERRIGRSLLEPQRLIGAGTNTGFVRAWAQAGVVCFGLPESGDATSEVSFWYAYRPVTGSWTKWTVEAFCAAQDFRGTSFYYARTGQWELRSSAYALEGAGSSGYDRAYSLSGWTYNSSTPSVTVTEAQRGTWAPKVGDWVSGTVSGSTEYREVTAVADSGTDRILTLASAFSSAPSASRVGYEAILPVMHWQAHCADPVTSALYSEIQVMMDFGEDEIASSTGPDIEFDVGGTTDRTGTAQTTPISVDRASVTPPSTVLRCMTPRDAARATHFYPYLTGGNVKMPWICLGVALVYEPASERTAR